MAKKATRKSARTAGKTKSAKATSVAKTTRKSVKPAAKPCKPVSKPAKLAKSPLSKGELAEFRKMLIQKRQAILGDMNGIEMGSRANRQDGSGDLSNMPTHPADIGTDNFEQEFTLGLLESERAMLAEINEALERVDGGTYGVCLGTGEFIGMPRLKARPWAKYCIEYARLIEKGLVRPGDDNHSHDDDDEDDDDELEGESSKDAEEVDDDHDEVEIEAVEDDIED